MSILTGIRDVDVMILSSLDYKSILNFSMVNKHVNKDNILWRKLFIKKYGHKHFKPDERSWKNHYLGLNRLKKFPIIFNF